MDIKDFVKESLVQIASGVKEAQNECSKFGCRVNPTHNKGTSNMLKTPDNSIVTEVKFKIGLTSGAEENGKQGFSVSFASFGMGIGKTSEEMNNYTSVTSLEFSVPVALPQLK